MSQERRRFIRVREQLLTFVTSLGTGKVQRTLTRDLGGGGMSFLADDCVTPGAKIALEINLPSHHAPILCTAEVVWSRPSGEPRPPGQPPAAETGVKFLEIAEKDRALIIQYVRLNAPPSYDP